MEFNKNQEERDIILENYFTEDKYSGGIRRFEKVPLKVLEVLIGKGFVNTFDRQNDSPTIREIQSFIKEFRNVNVSGYVVDVNRPDYRLSIDAIEGNIPLTGSALEEFTSFTSSCDERHFGDSDKPDSLAVYAWWD